MKLVLLASKGIFIKDSVAEASGGGNGPVQACTHTALTISTRHMGNQNPLVIVTERLYSHDLEATVLAKRSNPRVPSSYTVGEDGE
jgi:hypothetical protein